MALRLEDKKALVAEVNDGRAKRALPWSPRNTAG